MPRFPEPSSPRSLLSSPLLSGVCNPHWRKATFPASCRCHVTSRKAVQWCKRPACASKSCYAQELLNQTTLRAPPKTVLKCYSNRLSSCCNKQGHKRDACASKSSMDGPQIQAPFSRAIFAMVFANSFVAVRCLQRRELRYILFHVIIGAGLCPVSRYCLGSES